VVLLPCPIKKIRIHYPLLFLILFISELFAALAPAPAQPQVDLTGKNVLILHSFESDAPVFLGTDNGLLTTLEAGGIPRLNQFFESLDLRRNPGPEHRRLLVEQMQVRYGHRMLDMIITMYPEALEFVLKDGRNILPNVPILALYLPKGFELPRTDRRIIGHSASPDIIGTLEIALKLVPGAKHVYVVSGAHQVDRRTEDQARLISKKWEEQLEFVYLSRMSFEDILAALSTAPPDAVVLLLTYSQDITGTPYTAQNLTQRLSEVSTAPIFGLLDVALGYGIAGGSLINFERIGKRAGELVLSVLKSAPTTKNIPEFLDVHPIPMFDWRQLRRWKLSEAALPQGNIVINKKFTLWDLRHYVIGVLAFCLLETSLILILIVQRHRKNMAKESLRQRTEELDQFFNVNLDILSIASTEGYFLRLNPAVETILGYTREELMAQRFFHFIHPDDLDKTRKAVSTLESQEKVFLFENRYRRKDGAYRWLQWSSAPAGKLIYAAARDVTQHKQAEEDLKKYQEHLEEMVRERTAELVVARDEAESANRAKSTFLTNMSHELRTPLNSILGIAQLMERDPGFPSHHRDILKILSRSGTYLLDLINDVLEMSKIEAGKVAPVITCFDFHSFLGDLEEMMRLRADQKGLRLLAEYKFHLPQYIETDVRKLRQILINLLGNAIKYTEKGRVILRVAPEEDVYLTTARLEFEIEDTGIGIAPEDMQRIFEPFVQVNPGRAARDGTGLGLTLSRMFIEQLGGEITLRSQLGRGTVFAFHIPFKLAESAVIRGQQTDRRVTGLAPGQPSYRLLVVDDSVENRFILRRLLEQGGFTVLEAAGGQEAVDLYKSGQPHLIWMDLRMPGMDGNEAATRIREAESGMRHTPIIALTAGAIDYEEPFSRTKVFDDWVHKPFREMEIFDKIEKHLGVRFVYHPSAGSPVVTDKDQQKRVTPSDLAVLPVEWLREFFQGLRRGRSAQLMDLIGRISPDHAVLARTLTELVRVYSFDNLIAVTERALKEASHG
jgi:PAS domain S-box-containing protein